MVLKKSNTPFNSGATQKCFNKGAYRTINEQTGSELYITLRGLTKVYDEDNPSMEHATALEKIYDYLDFDGPSLKQFHESAGVCFWDQTVKDLCVSLTNQNLWFLPERINALMKEDNFLEGEEGLAEIRIVKVKKIVDRGQIHNKEKVVLNPRAKKVRKILSRHKTVQIKGKKRGLQRSHLLRVNAVEDDDDYYDWREERRRKIIEIELHEEPQIDARVLGGRLECYEELRKTKTHSKSKGSVNGRKSYLYKSHTPQQLRKEVDSVFHSGNAWMEDEDCYLWDDGDDAEMVDGCLEYYHDGNRELIADYPIDTAQSQWPKKRKKRSLHEDTHDEKLVNINTASSNTTVRYPKGSFQIIERPPELREDRDSPVSSDEEFVHIDKDEIQESNHIDKDENQESNHIDKDEIQESNHIDKDEIKESNHIDKDEIQESNVQSPEIIQTHDVTVEKTEIPTEFNTFETYDNFVPVNLQWPKDIEERMIEALLQSHCYDLFLDSYSVMLGNVFPPTFCVNLEQSDLGPDIGWSLVGISHTDISTNRELEWEVTLKNSKVCSGHDQVKDNFFSNLSLVDNTRVLQFQDLVRMALVSTKLTSNTLGNDKVVSKQKKRDVFDSSYSNFNTDPTPGIYSMELAVKRLQTYLRGKSQNPESPSMTRTNGCIEIPSDIVECDICFDTCDKHGQRDSGIITLLSCGHSFCYECWRSHAFHHVTQGDILIKCMHTDCKQAINEAAMNAIMPENACAKLHSRGQERCIDTSPLCQWCPRSKCNRVSMIDEDDSHIQQFGRHVVCDCNKSYCFTCQGHPHWPLSCSQAAAYRKLLRNLDGDIPVEVTCNVELKPCPGCRYPIEKNEGCPHMTCKMCHFDFCWNCLQPYDYHDGWRCSPSEDLNYKTYKIHTEVMNSFPLKFFADALEMNKKLRSIRTDKVHGWINKMNSVDSKKIKLPFNRSVQMEEVVTAKSSMINLATQAVSFLVESFCFLENFYILVSFALLNEERDSKKSFNASTQRVIDGLMQASSRLEELVVGKSISQLLSSENTGRMYLSNGREMLAKLKGRVASIQKASKDVPAQPIGELDPKPFYRYL